MLPRAISTSLQHEEGRGSASRREIESESRQKYKNRGPRPPQNAARVYICRLDKILAASAAGCRVVVVVVRGKSTSQTCQHIFR